jgi:N-acetylneuraminic acid mutarotase
LGGREALGRPRSQAASGTPPARRAAQATTWTDVSLAVGSAQIPARRQHALVADGQGNVYLFGGVGVDGARLNDLWRLGAAAGRWERVAPLGPVMPPPVEEAHLVADTNGDLYAFGGRLDELTLTNDLYRFEAASGRWVDLSASARAAGVPVREDHGWAFDPLRRQAYVFGGTDGIDLLNDFWRYDLAADTWTNLTSPSRAGAITPRELYNVTYDNHGHLLLFGGTGVDANSYAIRFDDFWRYDIATGVWEDISSSGSTGVPGRHYYGQAADADGNFYVLGGYLTPSNDSPPSLVMDDFWRYDATAASWARIDTSAAPGLLPRIPYGMAYRPDANALVVFGGTDGTRLVNDTWTLQLGGLQPGSPTPTASASPVGATATVTLTPTATPSDATATPSDATVTPSATSTVAAAPSDATVTPSATSTVAAAPSDATATPSATSTVAATPTATDTPPPAATATEIGQTPPIAPVSTVIAVQAAPATVDANNGSLRLELPAGVAEVDGQAVPVQLDLQPAPAPRRSPDLAGGMPAVRVEMRAPSGAPVTQLARPMTIKMGYTDADLRASGLRADQLRIYNSRDGVAWSPLSSQVDAAARRVSAQVDHLNIFALAQPLARQPNRLYLPTIAEQARARS